MLCVGIEIGQLPTEQHGVSGTLYVTDSRTLSFEGFNYDGLGPGSYVIQCMIPMVKYETECNEMLPPTR